jgi:octaprenyl-diphosphate synthase
MEKNWVQDRLSRIEAVLQAELPKEDEDWAAKTFFGEQGRSSFQAPPPLPPLSLTAPIKDLLNRGGKRWRPLLACMVCESLGGKDAVFPLLPLVEFCHNASLIHDDIEDGSTERRGKPAIHILYGEDAAVNSGSFLYFLPLTCIDRWEADAGLKLRAYSLWALNMRRLHLGQSLDIHWHNNGFFPEINEYYAMCRLKTGVLAAFAATAGVLAAENAAKNSGREANFDKILTPLTAAAENLGLGFQILDDVKNLTGGIYGKTQGDDVVEGKKSLPILLFVRKENPKQGEGVMPERAAFVNDCFAAAKKEGASSSAVKSLTEALKADGVLKEAEDRGRRLLEEAEKSIAGLGCGGISAFMKF